MPPVNFCRESPGTRLPPLDRMREPVRRRAARALALLLAVGATRAAQIFVSPSGHDTHGDGSEASPFRSVQAAVDAALDFGERALARLPRARRCSARTLTGVPARCHRAHGRRACVRHGDPVPAAQACGARPARAQHAHWGCWPVHTGDVDTPTLSRCNVTSWYVTRAVVWPPPAPRAGLTCA